MLMEIMLNRPGYHTQKAIIVSEGKDCWIAAAYGPEGCVLETAIEASKDKALLNLAGKLLEKLWQIDDIVNIAKGSIPFRKIDDSYEIKR